MLAEIAYPDWWIKQAAAVAQRTHRVGQVAHTDGSILVLCASELRKLAQIILSHMDNARQLARVLAGADTREKAIATLSRLIQQFPENIAPVEISFAQHELAEQAGNEDNPAEKAPIINARLALEIGRIRLGTRHLRVAQPEKIRQVCRSFFEP